MKAINSDDDADPYRDSNPNIASILDVAFAS